MIPTPKVGTRPANRMAVKIPFNRATLVGREIDYIREALSLSQLAGDGEFTKRCSEMIKAKTGGRSALLTHSCTAALEMAAILSDLKPGDEVIMPSFTFVSTANAVVLRGATPVFVDIDPLTLNIDPEVVARAVTLKTRAITAVHYAGVVAEMDALGEISRAHNLVLIEDAAQAYGSTYRGRQAGSLGDMAAFSFHETKNIVCGEGGAIVINRPEVVERAEIIREKGTNRSRFFRGQVDKYSWVDVGSSFLPGELVAAFLLGQLEQEDRIRKTRLALWDIYDQAFRPLIKSGRIGGPHIPAHCKGNGHIYFLLMRDLDERTAFIDYMRGDEIYTPFHYVPLHSAEAGRKFGRVSGPMTVTEDVTDRLVRLPSYFSLGQEADRVIDRALAFLG
jgi:dTDP-4-amino-4,6-dideoxygalactose transaminase